jgi:hypothetical protein
VWGKQASETARAATAGSRTADVTPGQAAATLQHGARRARLFEPRRGTTVRPALPSSLVSRQRQHPRDDTHCRRARPHRRSCMESQEELQLPLDDAALRAAQLETRLVLGAHLTPTSPQQRNVQSGLAAGHSWGSTCAVVGLHGNRLAGKGLGAEIDGHAVVIRLSYELLSLEARHGVQEPSQDDAGGATSLAVANAKHLAQCTHSMHPPDCSACFTRGARTPLMVDYTARLGGGTTASLPGSYPLSEVNPSLTQPLLRHQGRRHSSGCD